VQLSFSDLCLGKGVDPQQNKRLDGTRERNLNPVM
jgi:hypothetical protein